MSREAMTRGAGRTAEEMAQELTVSQQGSRLYKNRNYKEVSDELKAEALSNAIAHQMELLQTARRRGRVDLSNVHEVEAAAAQYMEACKLSNTYPTLLGFSASMGLSRIAVYRYLDRHPHSETAQFIDALRSSWAAILAQMGLTRQASEAVSIFLLKNSSQGLSDKAELDVTARRDDDEPKMSAEQIAAKWAELAEMLPED